MPDQRSYVARDTRANRKMSGPMASSLMCYLLGSVLFRQPRKRRKDSTHLSLTPLSHLMSGAERIRMMKDLSMMEVDLWEMLRPWCAPA